MKKFILKESQYKRILETGSNSAAMDLDIYVQPVHHDTSAGNENIIESIEETKQILDELTFMLESGKKMSQEQKSMFYGILDQIKTTYIDFTEN